MTSSLVGSEMCIRDRLTHTRNAGATDDHEAGHQMDARDANEHTPKTDRTTTPQAPPRVIDTTPEAHTHTPTQCDR
eukprot:12394732-Prorocentrum_lima.AAC.1